MKFEKIVTEMSLEEKAGLCSGQDFWFTKAVERLDIPGIMVSDGPHGLRKQEAQADHLGLSASVKAVCYPSGAGLASSFDRGLIGALGTELGKTAAYEHVHTLLGPAVNIKRSPLCGRNFEYLSEDPYLAGEMSAAYVRGVQSQNVGTSVKHFAANNQEYRRMSTNALVSQRALREIYLAPFEKTVKEGKPWTIMCSYNRINGVYSCENEWLLNEVLREEWGFDGIVMTDWGAMNRRVEALKAGLELEMPSSHGENDKKIVAAVQDGTLSMEVLDRAVTRLLHWIFRACTEKTRPETLNQEAQHSFARKAAGETAVLLKNDGTLPLAKKSRLAYIGGFAQTPRYQGGGSSHINSVRVTSALSSAPEEAEIEYVQGFAADGSALVPDQIQLAVEAAKRAQAAVIFAGLPDSFESEGYDRSHMDLPEEQNRLIHAVVQVQPHTVVVLHNGSPVTMPWAGEVSAILELYLGGEAVGEAANDLLFGDVNPSGKLAETFPLRLEDTPSFLQFPGDGHSVSYGEDIYVGYRWYDARKMNVLFPFGHGLSYTSFAYLGMEADRTEIRAGQPLHICVRVKNTGSRFGREAVQLYVRPVGQTGRPVQELKGFVKLALAPGEEGTAEFTLDRRSFAYYETRIEDWFVPGGTYQLCAGTSSRELPLCTEITVHGDRPPVETGDTVTIGDVVQSGLCQEELRALLEKSGLAQTLGSGADLGDGTGAMVENMMAGMPLHSLVSFGPVGHADVEALIRVLKEAAEAQKAGDSTWKHQN